MSFPKFHSVSINKISRLLTGLVLGMSITFVSCSAITLSKSSPATSQVSQSSSQLMSQTQAQKWRRMTAQEVERHWTYVLDSPLGIAALNRLAIEGFIAPNCTKTWYVNETTEFQSVLQVNCPTERGVGRARGLYDEMRVIFNRFESSIENFEVEPVYDEDSSTMN